MKRLTKVILISICSLFICAAFANKHNARNKTKTETAVPKQTIKVNAAQPEFIIRIDANPTTGYSWFLKKMDHSLVKVLSHQYIAPQPQMPGAGGYEEWHFLAKPAAFTAPKTTIIKMIYARPWEKTPVREVDYYVQTSSSN